MMHRLLFLSALVLLFTNALHAQVFTSSNLPIVIITTDNASPIPDEPGVFGGMKILYRGPGLRNYVTDQDSALFLNYNGRVDIEIRGSYSQVLPKKAYGFTTVMADNTTNNNVSLLGMPSENDWILNGLSSDPSLIRDYISYNLSRKLGVYATRTAYCEVVINGAYKGLYILQEKIKADNDRVDVIKITTANNSAPELTGGYITKADKTTGGDPVAWYMSTYYGNNDIAFIHDLPKPSEVTSSQHLYIKGVFEYLKNAAIANNTSPLNGYQTVIDIPSFVDFMLINELASNADAYTFSTYFHKDRNAKLRAGPIWDLNLTYGNDLFELGFDRSKTDVWQFADGSNEGARFFRDLFNSAQYKCYFSKRWHEFNQPGGPLNLSTILDLIDTTVVLINEARIREDALWGTVGNHAYHISNIKTFVYNRINWINSHIGSYTNCANVVTPPLVITKIMYNPATSTSFPNSNDQEFIEITNAGNSPVDLTGIYFAGTGFVYQFPFGSTIWPNTFIRLASNPMTYQSKFGVAPFGQFTRNLSNSNYELLLADAFGNVIDHVHYYDDAPWPDADGNGKYLQLANVALDNALAANWIALDETVLGLETIGSNDRLFLSPNPVVQSLHINADKPIEQIQILDLQGRIVKSLYVGGEHLELDLSRLSAGIYFIKAITQSEILTGRIIKE